MSRRLEPGDIVVARFPEHRPPGREQHGVRPAIVAGIPDRLGPPRFPVVLLIPLTTDRGQVWVVAAPRLYPRLPAGAGGLPNASVVLLDQTRSIWIERVSGWLGTLDAEDYQPIHMSLLEVLRVRFPEASPEAGGLVDEQATGLSATDSDRSP